MFWICFLALLLAVTGVFAAVYVRRWYRAEGERKTLRAALERERSRGEEEERRKRDLVAFLAHDLKTPLTSVVGYLTLLRDRPDLTPEERSRFTAVALDKALRLEELLGEFFDISRMELENEEEEVGPVQLTLLLEQITDEFYPIFQSKELTLAARIAPGLVTTGDGEKLARVFDNVLRNAVSYSHPGGEVRLTAEREGDWLHVRVSNQGLTIPEGELSNIFDKFYRLDAARSSATGGAGLGLAIAREIVSHHGGVITAESTGHTTVFHITLPAR